MAYLTIEQADVIEDLVNKFGRPTYLKLEQTAEPYGLDMAFGFVCTKSRFIHKTGR